MTQQEFIEKIVQQYAVAFPSFYSWMKNQDNQMFKKTLEIWYRRLKKYSLDVLQLAITRIIDGQYEPIEPRDYGHWAHKLALFATAVSHEQQQKRIQTERRKERIAQQGVSDNSWSVLELFKTVLGHTDKANEMGLKGQDAQEYAMECMEGSWPGDPGADGLYKPIHTREADTSAEAEAFCVPDQGRDCFF